MTNAYSIVNAPLPRALRAQLESTVKAAREIAEKSARAALSQLAVAEAKAPDYLSEDQKALRRRLRAHGRALGDEKSSDDTQATQHLIWEIAYEHWHRMLFARFLAESGLLLWEPGAPVSLDDCRDFVDNHPDMAMGAKSHWELASKLATRMLPQVFKPHSPVFELSFAPERQRELEKLLEGLPSEVFTASDSLGWVYQFWQAKRKDEVNASETKIGADELAAVTQLFTEPYMVDFLLHNSLGAWWVTRHPGKPCPVPLTYLRTLDDGTPAAGKFEGWPNTLSEFKLLDPCCGSGHFLVAAFLLLVPMRMAAEGLPAAEAVDAVLANNLHGLELDPRCVEIAVFALALTAWRFPGEAGNSLGVRSTMPAPKVACCGLKVAASAKDWEALVPDSQKNAQHLRQELALLHESFAQSPVLGSLLEPTRSMKNDLATSNFIALKDVLENALATETPAIIFGRDSNLNEAVWDLALSARGLLEASQLLDARYNLVITNVPYLTRGKQARALRDYCEKNYPDAKSDLANVFLERCIELSQEQGRGVVQIVMPQNWLYLISYKKQRESLLKRVHWNFLARLGAGAFDTISGEVVQAILLTQTIAAPEKSFQLRGIDASVPKVAQEKAALLCKEPVVSVSQNGLLTNPDSRVTLEDLGRGERLDQYCNSYLGLGTCDAPHYTRKWWEISPLPIHWRFIQTAPDSLSPKGGRETVVSWDNARNRVLGMSDAERKQGHNQDYRGSAAWTKQGVSIALIRNLRPAAYDGELFDKSVAVLVPRKPEYLNAIRAYAESPEYVEAVRVIDQNLMVTNSTLTKVPFDLGHWQQVAAVRYPNGFPKLYSDEPTQWPFHGHPQPATDPLQVAIARLVGFRWPVEIDLGREITNEVRNWIISCEKLAEHVDDDGIVCLASVRGDPPAHDRLLKLLIAAWETVQPGSWKPSLLDKMLADVDCIGKGLDGWLRDKFFEQHAKLFHHRPFIWHVWDGLKDGFGALVNYHKLDTRNLERLIHTYLGDWIRQQEAGVRESVDGAQTRLAAAHDLKRRLELILEGEAPYDIFVRWKSLAEQPMGWDPDLNDGVRMNIRPFMTAEVLRHNKKPKLNITWEKDRGKDVESAPWFKQFKGDRINDHHLTLAEKQKTLRKAS